MQELENLLNSLIQRGRKPKDRETVSIKLDKEFTKSEGKTVFYCGCRDWFWFYADLRWLVSLESWLWQFVCENELYKEDDCWEWRFTFDGVRFFYYKSIPKFRLLESALIPEEELGKFLIDNIKVEWNSK